MGAVPNVKVCLSRSALPPQTQFNSSAAAYDWGHMGGSKNQPASLLERVIEVEHIVSEFLDRETLPKTAAPTPDPLL